MNETQRAIALQRLARLDLPEVAELLKNGADDQRVLEALEDSLLKKNESYQLFLRRPSRTMPSPQYGARIRSRFVRSELADNPQYRFLYALLQPIDQSLDCGCGATNQP